LIDSIAGIKPAKMPGKRIIKREVDGFIERYKRMTSDESFDQETLRTFLANNIRLLRSYTQSGKIKGNILAFEAMDNEERNNMQEWGNYTDGEVNHHFIKGSHWDMLLEDHFALYKEAIMHLTTAPETLLNQ
ncbi:MAG TPA: hypothetical protein VLB84_07645, partial [Bacteroidia bacterium]|nr:hypothetical protein [Bacteroidia bacterium]